MYTPVNRPPKWEKQAPKALKKVSNGGLPGVWNRPTESGILDAWAVLLQEAPAGSRLHGDAAWLVKYSWAFRESGKKRKKNPPSGQIGFLLGQGYGIGILSLDSHPWKRLTPSCGRACIFCYFRLKGETSNGPYSYGLPWAHRPLHGRRISIRPLPASQGTSPAVTRGGF